MIAIARALDLWGLSEERIAGITGQTQDVVHRTVARGREKLVEVLDADYPR